MSLTTPYHFENVPTEMKARDAWVTFKKVLRPGRSKADKPPFIAGCLNTNASSTNKYTWRPFAAAEADVKRGRKSGLGYCLEDSGLVGIDLDHVRDPRTREIAGWAMRLVEHFSSYSDVSVSGTGLHILVRGHLPAGSKNKIEFADGSSLEVWDSGRYLTMTGELVRPQLATIRDYDFTNFWPMLEGAMKAYMPFKNDTRLDLEQWLTRYNVHTLSKKVEAGKTIFEIECPGTHGEYPKDDGRCFAIQFPDGALSCGCQHDSCSFSKQTGNHWRELREWKEPDARQGPPVKANGSGDGREAYTVPSVFEESPPPPAVKNEPNDADELKTPPKVEPREASDSIETFSSPPLDFPPCAWRGAFADYLACMKGTTEACDVAHFATFWTTCATVLGRSVWMNSGDRVYPNVYLLVYGESGDKKTTAQRRVHFCQLLEGFPFIKLVRGTGSTEGLADTLAGDGITSYLFVWEEFSTLLAQARWTNSTLLGFITETFDCPFFWERNYRKNPIRLEKPTPNILTCSTPAWFWKYARPEDFYGGFGNRFFFVEASKQGLIPDPEAPRVDMLAVIRKKLGCLTALDPQPARWSPDAQKLWRSFYREIEGRERKGLLGAATKRLHIYTRKLVMVYAALEETYPEITEDQLAAATAVARYGVLSAERLLESQAVQSQPLAELEQRLLRWIIRHPGQRVRTAQQANQRYCGSSEVFNRVLRSLRESDRIEIDSNRRIHLTS